MSDEMPGDDRLKKAFAASGGDAASPGGCPGDEAIWAAARGELPHDRARELLDHSLTCADCEQSFRMAAEMMAEMREAGVAGAATSPGETSESSLHGPERVPAEIHPFPMRRRFVLTVGAIAAAALLTIALPALLRHAGVPPSPTSFGTAVATTLWRVGEDGDVPLADGERIRPGDRLYMTLQSDAPVYLYVINRDDTGESSALFPIEGAQWSNPVQPGAVRRIPGETTWDYDSWEVSSPGGRDAFIIVAARDPIPRLEAALERIAAATPLDSGEYVRGGGSESPGEPSEETLSQRALDTLLGDLSASSAAGESELLIRRIVLENPR